MCVKCMRLSREVGRVKGSNAPRGKCVVLKSVIGRRLRSPRRSSSGGCVVSDVSRAWKLKSNGTQAKRRCACSTSTWAASGCRGEAESRTNITPPFTFTVFNSCKSSSPPYRKQPIAALETKPALPARLNRPLQADRHTHPRAHPSATPLQTTTTTMSEAYERERYPPRPLKCHKTTN
jgi:hypothetical protein